MPAPHRRPVLVARRRARDGPIRQPSRPTMATSMLGELRASWTDLLSRPGMESRSERRIGVTGAPHRSGTAHSIREAPAHQVTPAAPAFCWMRAVRRCSIGAHPSTDKWRPPSAGRSPSRAQTRSQETSHAASHRHLKPHAARRTSGAGHRLREPSTACRRERRTGLRGRCRRLRGRGPADLAGQDLRSAPWRGRWPADHGHGPYRHRGAGRVAAASPSVPRRSRRWPYRRRRRHRRDVVSIVIRAALDREHSPSPLRRSCGS